MTFQESLAALHNDRRNLAIRDITITLAILAGAIWLLARHPGPWTYSLAYIVIGLMQYRIVIACHEAVHKKLFFPLWLNESFGSVYCALIGINLLWYRRQHLAHHGAQDLSHDTDAYIFEPILRQRPGFRRVAIWIFGTAREMREKLRLKGFNVNATIEAEGKARLYSLAIVAVQGLLLLFCTLWLSWWYYFAFWVLPLGTIAVFMNRTRVLIEHGYAHVPRREGFPLSASPVKAIDLSAGFFGQFFIAPFMFNYHRAHHRAPSIPYYRCHDLLQLLEQHGEAAASENPSYLQALRHILWN